jgi:hypothetical protein
MKRCDLCSDEIVGEPIYCINGCKGVCKSCADEYWPGWDEMGEPLCDECLEKEAQEQPTEGEG